MAHLFFGGALKSTVLKVDDIPVIMGVIFRANLLNPGSMAGGFICLISQKEVKRN